MTIVRSFSPAGPCLTLGRLTKETAQFFFYDDWCGGDVFEARGSRVKKPGGKFYSRAHTEACHSCRDHPKTQFPRGYMD
jgi:hypothetical protein